MASGGGKGCMLAGSFLRAAALGLVVLASAAPVARSWSKEGHMLTCQIAQVNQIKPVLLVRFLSSMTKIIIRVLLLQDLLEPDAAHAVRNLLPEDVGGDLSALCVWPDQVRHWYKYRWSGPLHFIDTPDKACTFDYASE